jgi:diamine N-acetyltransferase
MASSRLEKEAMDITLRPITPDNWKECISLQVHEHQRNFVAPNVYSLAQAKVFPECIPLAIYAGDTMVGFIMYEFDTEDGTPWIFRFMIDREHQGKGYGRAAFQEAIMRIEAQSERDEIMITASPENEAAKHLYPDLGFEYTGQEDNGEMVMRLRLR